MPERKPAAARPTAPPKDPTSPPRVALVTGGTSGIGHATALALAHKGLDVTLLVRDEARGLEAADGIRSQVPGARVGVVVGDLAEQASVRAAAAEVARRKPDLDLLVHVAGVFLPERKVTSDGVEATFATNYLGGYLLTELLLPTLRRNAPSRIVTVASRYGRTRIDFTDLNLERRKFSYLKAVPASKLAQVLWTQDLADRLAGSGVTANAVHPGLVANTNLLTQTGGMFQWLTNRLGKTPDVGADTVVWLATSSEAAGETGGLWHKRKRLKTPGQGADPQARRQLREASERLCGTGAEPSANGVVVPAFS